MDWMTVTVLIFTIMVKGISNNRRFTFFLKKILKVLCITFASFLGLIVILILWLDIDYRFFPEHNGTIDMGNKLYVYQPESWSFLVYADTLAGSYGKYFRETPESECLIPPVFPENNPRILGIGGYVDSCEMYIGLENRDTIRVRSEFDIKISSIEKRGELIVAYGTLFRRRDSLFFLLKTPFIEENKKLSESERDSLKRAVKVFRMRSEWEEEISMHNTSEDLADKRTRRKRRKSD